MHNVEKLQRMQVLIAQLHPLHQRERAEEEVTIVARRTAPLLRSDRRQRLAEQRLKARLLNQHVALSHQPRLEAVLDDVPEPLDRVQLWRVLDGVYR